MPPSTVPEALATDGTPLDSSVVPNARGPRELAQVHRDIKRTGDPFLERRDLDAIEGCFARARKRFRAERHEDPSTRALAEWLFDNYYLVRRVLGQLRWELPFGFQRRLPRLALGGGPRALAVAETIYNGGTRELDLDTLEGFLAAYQEITELTIAELWALPALLRLVILQRFCEVLERALDNRRPGSSSSHPSIDPGSAAGRAVRALRLLAEVDWKETFCRQSKTEKLLREDPAGAYTAMDFETRDAYRRAIEEIAFSAKLTEGEVTRAVLDRAHEGPPDGRHDHVGEWLLGGGRRLLERTLGARPGGLERHVLAHPRLVFFGLLLLAQLALLAPVIAYLLWLRASFPISAAALVLCWIPASVPAAAIVYWLVSKLVPPRVLPKLDFSAGVPKRWRTLVAVPTLLGERSEIDRLIAELEVHYLANPDPELRFALLTDHLDAETPPQGEQDARLAHAKHGIRGLNARYGRDNHGPFHLLHRASRWNPAEGKWMGWERKRGKLEELNRYLRGAADTNYALHVGDPAGLEGIAFVLTLDSDTELPQGAAGRLAGALAHPLNRPCADAGGRVRAGYTVIQPRVEISPRSARRSAFSHLFSGDTGIDIYTRAVSDIYQDLFGEGIYVGKGIYDVDAFGASLYGRVPDNALVSHDLFEGVHGRAALATDVVVYEDYPPHYPAYLHRMHRWIRGDWQLLPWLLPRVPKAGGGTMKNHLGLVDRFKIADNLRRSLVAPALVALLLCGWLVLPGHPLFWTLAALLAPSAAAVWSILHTGSLPRRELGRWFLALCFAPQEARTVLDATGRVFIRMLWTRKRMLEWTTAAQSARMFHDDSWVRYFARLWVGPATALSIGVGLSLFSPGTLLWAAPWLLLWLVSPELARRIGLPTPALREELDQAQVRTLRRVARRTWFFFETFVSPRDHWLPPDHFQEHPRGVAAHRTSPTNIGMLLLSELAAYDLGYLGQIGLASWVSNTLDTLERLERHRGHIYNWYNTHTLAPLEPRYVSTVDSGNLAGALVALAIGCERIAKDPPLRPEIRCGLLDAAELLAEAVANWAAASDAAPSAAALELSHALVTLLAGADTCDRSLLEAAGANTQAIEAQLLEGLRSGGTVSHDPSLLRELRMWLDRLSHQLAEAKHEVDLLVPELDGGKELALSAIPSACESGRAQVSDTAARTTLERAGTEATALTARLRELAQRARKLAEVMDFRFLYDEERRLFHVGHGVTADRLDPHHYDLLASEARLASYLAIVWRQVPLQHWFALGRPLAHAGRRGRALLSWGGSMFEYLMPRLLMRSHDDTLLDQSCEAAVERQIAYGRENDTPWGISESGYAFLDGQQAYQYRAFGVPGLGLRRGLEEDLVIAPYASLLALPFRPLAVAENLARLEELGMVGRFGLYEAADFHAQRAPGGRPARVLEYMSHHHGMSFVAIANHLCQDVMVERFHADPHVRCGALLLDERVPVEMPAERPLAESTGTPDVALTPPVTLSGWEPDRGKMQLWAIGNDTLTSFITADGGGGLRWRDLAVTRWDSDPVADTHGTWIYLHDLDSGETIGASPGPVGNWPEDAHIRFEAKSVEFHRRYKELAIRMRITVASGEDVEIRELEIANEGDRARRIRVTGCLEPVLEPERQAARHPAFSKLFLRCSPVSELRGVLVSRLGGGDRPAPILLFRMTGDRASDPRLVEIDRCAFLGRRGSFHSPAALVKAPGDPAEQTLDPLCACAAELELPPGSSRVVAFITALAPTTAEVLDLGRRFGSPSAVRWAFEDAARAAARRVQRLQIQADLLPTAQRLLSALLVPDAARRAPEPILSSARPSQRSLWGRGISGDEPIVLVRMSSGESSELTGELLAVHRYLRALGVHVDVVFIDEAPSGYIEAASEAVRKLLVEHGAANLLGQRGGIHVVPADQAGGEELAALAGAARVHLDWRNGSLRSQMDKRPEVVLGLPRFEPAGPPPGVAPDPELALEVPELAFDNGFGGFDGDEYVVRPGACPPAPWCNVIANERFGCLVSEAALGSSWSINAGENRLTPWHNDPVLDPPAEALYLRDEETARVWTTTPQPCGVPTLVRHGHGYTIYRLVCPGLDQTMTVFVPPDQPLKVIRLRIRNAAGRPRRLTATYYAEWVLGTRRRETRPYVLPSLSARDSCLCAETSWSMDFAGRVAFLAADRTLHGYTTDRVEVLGRGGDLSHPAALGRWGLSGRVAPGLDPCAALQVHVDLGAGEETELSFFLGQAEDRERALDLIRGLRAPRAVEQAWQSCRAYWDRLLGAVRVHTPDAALDRLCNRWLIYQSLASRFFGRTALYQSSGAFGFRDQLQDALAFVHSDTTLTRRHLLEAAAHQFALGDVLHWWHPPSGAGVRTRCSDDLLWLVYTTAEYVAATADVGVLSERVPFLAGDPLEKGEDVRYGRFAPGEEATLLEHCRRALSRGFTTGAHGLPLIGDGDWNDGMNRVGTRGRGESIWLGWFVYACTVRLASLLEQVGERAEAERWRNRLPALARALSEHGWDGGWYLRAYDDDGAAIGSAHSAPPHIDSIAQSWAVLSGAGDPDKIAQALASAERMLVRQDDRLVLLLAPPFGPHGPDPGYIAAYPPGVRENGGQYTHAAAWLGWAHAERDDGNAAYRILSLLNPLERTRSREDVERYGVEPYVLAADVYARPPWVGRGGWTWYSGAAAWTWRLAVEGILGLRRRHGGLEVDPCLPSHWDGFEAWVREGELTVHVVVHNADATGRSIGAIHLDGESIERASIELVGKGERQLEIWLGAVRRGSDLDRRVNRVV